MQDDSWTVLDSKSYFGIHIESPCFRDLPTSAGSLLINDDKVLSESFSIWKQFRIMYIPTYIVSIAWFTSIMVSANPGEVGVFSCYGFV